MEKRLNHVAIAVPDLNVAVSFYRDVLQCPVSEPVDLPEHGVSTVFVTLENTKIELLGVYGAASPIASFLARNPQGGIHHLCLEVNNLDAEIAHVHGAGIRVLGDEKNGASKIGAHGVPVVFLHPKDCCGTLIELEAAI